MIVMTSSGRPVSYVDDYEILAGDTAFAICERKTHARSFNCSGDCSRCDSCNVAGSSGLCESMARNEAHEEEGLST